ncbi:MAG TPA: LysR family transcriptional regulator [Gemmatimonadaceae bacterium]|jgi:DNA-binding transcriptional LysR family regulator
MSLNLHLLRLFTAVVEHDGVVAAARGLRISQPAISRAVRELEQQLGLTLLERTSRRVRLTSDGAEIYAQARAVFAAERAVAEAVDELKGLARGVLRIGASTTIATYVLPAIISEFSRRYPQIELRLSAVHTRVILGMLHNFELDVALAEAPVEDEMIEVEPWRTDEMVMIAAGSHPLARKKAVSRADLANELFLLREPESGTRGIVLRALADAGIEIKKSMSIDGTEVIKQIVAEGFGVAVVSRHTISDLLATKRLVTLNVPSLNVTRPFNRLQLRGRRPSATARAFLAALEENASQKARM